jgi:hypothetical protein
MHLKTFAHAEQRSVSVAELHYNADGTIQEVPYFLDNELKQVKPFDPYRRDDKLSSHRVEAETMAWGYGLKTSYVDEEYEFDDNVGYLPRNMYVHDIDDGEYLMIRGVNFGRKGAKKIIASIGSDGLGCMEIHLDSPDGPAVGVISVTPTGGKKEFSTFTKRFKKRLRGVHDLYFVFNGVGKDLFTFDWWKMK